MVVEQLVSLDINKKSLIVYAKQADHKGRVLRIQLMDYNKKIEVPAGVTVTLRALKPDGTSVINNGSRNSDGTVSVELTDQVLAVEGMTLADVSIAQSGVIVSSATFVIKVGVASSNEFLQLEALIAQATQLITNYVSTGPQELSDTQKAQVRRNIGAENYDDSEIKKDIEEVDSRLSEAIVDISENIKKVKPSDLYGVIKSGESNVLAHEKRIEYTAPNTSAWKGLFSFEFPIAYHDKLYFVCDDAKTTSQNQVIAVTRYDASGNAIGSATWLRGTVGTVEPYTINDSNAVKAKVDIYLATNAPTVGETYYVDNLYILKNSSTPSEFKEYSFDDKFKIGKNNLKEDAIPKDFTEDIESIRTEVDEFGEKLDDLYETNILFRIDRIEYKAASTATWKGDFRFDIPVSYKDKIYITCDDYLVTMPTGVFNLLLYDANGEQIRNVWLPYTFNTDDFYTINDANCVSVKVVIWLVHSAGVADTTYFVDNLAITKNTKEPYNKIVIRENNLSEDLKTKIFGASDAIPDAIMSEIEDCKSKLLSTYVSGRTSYIFLTDLHYENYENNEPTIQNSIKYAVKLANESDVDFICLGGDYIDSATTKAEAQSRYNKMFSLFGECRKPVVAVRGNHDNSVTEGLSVGELFSLTQSVTNDTRFVYDESVTDGMYFYFDIPNRKTRVVCIDSWTGNGYANEQLKFVADKVLTKKDGWNYVFVSHVPPLEKYETDGMNQRWSWGCGTWNEFQLNNLLIAFNESESITDSVYGTKDFTGNTSKVICINFGHTHASHVEYDNDLKSFCVSTGCALSNGGQGVFNDTTVARDDNQTTENRRYMALDNPNKYLFDVISVSRNKINRIRFGNGIDKEVTV